MSWGYSPDLYLYLEMAKQQDQEKKSRKGIGGKPSRVSMIMQKMAGKLSDTGKLVVQELATKLDRKLWTEQEIIDAITDDGLDEIKYIMTGGDKGLTMDQKKAKATEIRKAIVQRRHDVQAEVVKTLESGAPKGRGKFVFASEFMKSNIAKGGLSIDDALITALKVLKDIGKSDPKYDYEESEWLNHKASGNINNFLSNLISQTSSKLSQAIEEYDDSFDEEQKEKLWKIIDVIQSANRNIVWPDWEKDIKSHAQLKAYFEFLRSDKEMSRAEKAVGGYKRKGKVQERSRKVDYSRDFLKLMYDAVNETRGMMIEDEDFDKKATQLAKQYLKENKWLKNYMMDEYGLAKDSDDDEITDELKAEMAFEISRLRNKLGKKHNV